MKQSTNPIPISYDTLQPGIELDQRYKLKDILGKGGFGKVFLAEDKMLEQQVALKILKPDLAKDSAQLKRFRREVVIARKINHISLCKLYDVGQVGDLTYLTMEYIDGENFDTLLLKYRDFPWKTGLWICHQIASGLWVAHKEGVVHRDLKPQNIRVSKKGVAKILDFGIARMTDSHSTMTGGVLGTPAYMSPEQAQGMESDPRSDLYSLGVIMYQIFTGTTPFAADTPMGILFQHVHQPPRPPIESVPKLPRGISDIIVRCLAKKPADRFSSAEDLINSLENLMHVLGWPIKPDPDQISLLFEKDEEPPEPGLEKTVNYKLQPEEEAPEGTLTLEPKLASHLTSNAQTFLKSQHSAPTMSKSPSSKPNIEEVTQSLEQLLLEEEPVKPNATPVSRIPPPPAPLKSKPKDTQSLPKPKPKDAAPPQKKTEDRPQKKNASKNARPEEEPAVVAHSSSFVIILLVVLVVLASATGFLYWKFLYKG